MTLSSYSLASEEGLLINADSRKQSLESMESSDISEMSILVKVGYSLPEFTPSFFFGLFGSAFLVLRKPHITWRKYRKSLSC